MKLFLMIVSLVLFYESSILGIEVPLEGAGGGTTIGFVDMDELFEGYGKVIEVKKEYNKLREERNKELGEIEGKIENMRMEIKENEDKIIELKQELGALKSSVQLPVTDIVVKDSTGTVYMIEEIIESPSPSASLDERMRVLKQIREIEHLIALEENVLEKKNREISIMQKEYEDKKAQVEKELKEFEESKTLKIMAEFYRIIEELAKEENISIVVEKTNVLYGQSVIDLTGKVKERLRGK
jgi:Skp family chaperone for outer membrane proteins